MIWALGRDMYGYGRHFGSFYRNPTILETVSDFDSSSWQLNLSTAQNDFSKFRPGWWQFCWMTGVKFNSIHSILVKLHITQFTVCAAKIWQFLLPIHHDVSSDQAWWLPYREPCESCQGPASAGLGSPGDRRSHSGHVGNSRRRRLITCCRL